MNNKKYVVKTIEGIFNLNDHRTIIEILYALNNYEFIAIDNMIIKSEDIMYIAETYEKNK